MSTHKTHLLVISLLLAIGTFAAFRPVTGCRFVNYDDPRYLDVPQVHAGLTISGIKWAFTTTHASNWHPLTWISLMLDRSIYGSHPSGYHVTSLLFHIASAILLFLLLARITGSVWRSGFVAALFAIHPLHVESVAWVAERKDVLSTVLMMLALWAYVLYTEKPTMTRRISAVSAFALGLMAKPMLVTLPFVLVLLDYWPLGRFKARKKNQPWVGFRLISEKLPFFILSGISCVITYVAQHRGGTTASLEQIPTYVRFENSLLSYVGYMWKTVWPAKLAFFYPYSTHVPALWKVFGALIILACISALAIRKAKSHPYLAVGWLWFLGTLVPVIGLVQVGNQAMPDRYTYVPLIGLFIMIAWGVADHVRLPTSALPALAAVIFIGLGMLTYRQAGVWHDSASLSRHAIAVTRGNYEAYCMLGVVLTDQGKPLEAIEQFAEAIKIKRDSPIIHTGMANALAHLEKYSAAAAEYRKAIRLQPDYPLAHYNLGMMLAGEGKLNEAIEHLSKVVEINRGPAGQPELFVPGKSDDTLIQKLTRAIRANPSDARNQYKLGMVLARNGRLEEAITHFSKARGAGTGPADKHFYQGNSLSDSGDKEAAIREYREAISLKPDFAAAHNNLAVALFFTGDYAEAWKEVHLCRKYGLEPPSGFLQALSAKMADPYH